MYNTLKDFSMVLTDSVNYVMCVIRLFWCVSVSTIYVEWSTNCAHSLHYL